MVQFRLLTFTYIATVCVSCVLGVRDAYSRIEGESFDVNQGAAIAEPSVQISSRWASTKPGDVIGYKRLNFSAETIAFQMHIGCYTCRDYPKRKVFLHLDTPTSPAFVDYTAHTTGDHWLVVTQLIPFTKRPRGVHDLYFTFDYVHAKFLVGIDWFTFIADDAPPKPDCPIPQVVHCPITTDTVTLSISPSDISPKVVHQQSTGDCEESSGAVECKISPTDTSQIKDSCSTATERKRKITFVMEDY